MSYWHYSRLVIRGLLDSRFRGNDAYMTRLPPTLNCYRRSSSPTRTEAISLSQDVVRRLGRGSASKLSVEQRCLSNAGGAQGICRPVARDCSDLRKPSRTQTVIPAKAERPDDRQL